MFLQSEKLVGSNEIISLFCKQVCDHQGSIHRTLVTVMHQEDGTVMNLGTDNGQDAVCAAAFPVQGIDRPQDHRCADGCFDSIIHRTVRRTYHRCTLAGEVNKLLIYPGDLGTDVF